LLTSAPECELAPTYYDPRGTDFADVESSNRADDSPPIMVGRMNLPLAGDESNRKEQSELAIDPFIRVFVPKHILNLIVIMDQVT